MSIEARGAESGGKVLGEGQTALSHQLEVLRSAVISPAEIGFGAF